MTQKYVDQSIIELLRSLREPVELCDEAGLILGTFTPERAELVAADAAAARTPEWEGDEDLGIELDAFDYRQNFD